MKKSFFLILIALAIFTSCTKEVVNTLDGTSVKTSDLPVSVSEYVLNNFPDATITDATRYNNVNQDVIVVTLNTREEITFDINGLCLYSSFNINRSDSIVSDTIIVNDSIPCDSIHHHHHHHHGNGGNNGNGNHPGEIHHHHGCHPHGEINPDSLALGITDYIALNYAAYTIIHAENDTLCSVGAVTKVVAILDSVAIQIFFDTNSSFLMIGTRTHISNLPQVIQDYIALNYAGFESCHKTMQLTLADGTTQYIVYLHQADVRKQIIFNADGTLVCEN